MVVQSSRAGHVISGGIHVPKAVGVHSDQGSGHDFGCDWERPMGPGQVWSGPTEVGRYDAVG